MIQQVKRFHVTSLTVQGFKGYAQAQTFYFGDMNTISGHMGVGKSSIADAIAFAVTGVPFFGSAKLDVLYHQGSRDLLVDMAYEDENGSHRLVRRRVNDDMDISLDGRKVTQRDLTILFGERDLFLSMFNPLYFIETLGGKGRDLLERYLPDIPRETIMEGLSEGTRQQLAGCDFLSPEAFAKQLRGELVELDRDVTYSQGQMDLLTSQAAEQSTALEAKQEEYRQSKARLEELEARRTAGLNTAELEERRADLYARHEELLREPADTPDTGELDRQLQDTTQALEHRRAETYQSKYAQAIAETQAKVNSLSAEVKRQKHILPGLKPGVQCPMCRQTVTEATLPEVRGEFEKSLRELCRQGQEQMAQMRQLQELDAKAKAVFEQFQADDIAAGEQKLAELTQQREQAVEMARQSNERRVQQAAELRSDIQSIELDLDSGMLTGDEAAELQLMREKTEKLAAELEVLNAQAQAEPGRREKLVDAMAAAQQQQAEKKGLLSALAIYISRRVELTFSKLKMNRVSISLYEVVKTTGEIKDVFKFNYEDRPYLCLSHSEKIRAGLEVTELVKRLIGVDYPVFIDDTESVPVIDNVRPSGQIFLARVVKGAQLNVQAANTSAPPAAKAA